MSKIFKHPSDRLAMAIMHLINSIRIVNQTFRVNNKRICHKCSNKNHFPGNVTNTILRKQYLQLFNPYIHQLQTRRFQDRNSSLVVQDSLATVNGP